MDILTRLNLNHVMADGRLGANLIAIHGVITFTVIISLIIRRVLVRGGGKLARFTGLRSLEAAGDEAIRRVRLLLSWLTALAIMLICIGGVCYHFAGHDVRHHMKQWYASLTVEELLDLGLRGLGFLAVLTACWFAVRMVHWVRPLFETEVKSLVGREGTEQAVHRWFGLLQLYTLAAIRILAVWAVLKVFGSGEWASVACAFLLRLLSILVVARLLTLSCRVLAHCLADLGQRYLSQSAFRNYWERVRRLFPFGERCFEAAVWVTAASLCVRVLHFLDPEASLGPRIVKCIGIFFVTRVLIELLQVLMSEAFGLYDDDDTRDQKSRTLVPLLYSISQYVLYFGSALVMLGVLNVDTTPILAGAGILGLAVGLGAQSLVTDVVSGFFILFENQYLVGDYVQIGDAVGIVEAVGIRVTHIRDGHGKVYIIPNGQIKGVISYSKGYVNAVVDLKVSTGADLETIFRCMAEAGRRLKLAHHEVLAETQIHGLVDLGTSDMTVRAVTRVRPGSHALMQSAYRKLLKQVLDQSSTSSSRSAAAA